MDEKKHCKWYKEEMCVNGDSPCVADYCPVVEYPELCKYREFDKDINVRSKDNTEINVGMTDEEIVKALEHCYHNRSCEYCYHNDELGSGAIVCRSRLMGKSIDLIHRLQGEIKEYETLFDIFNNRKYRKMFNEEWKKEYQKELDKQGEGVIAGFPDGDYVYQRYFDQKAEIERLNLAVEGLMATNKVIDKENTELIEKIERLTEEKKTAWRKFKQKADESIELSMLLDKRANERAELQKQVDELTEEKNDLIEARRLDSEVYVDLVAERNELQKQVDELKANQVIECHGMLKGCDMVNQAVKDRAKEILTKIFKGGVGGRWLAELCEEYGVEVE